jgi:hypothetical protein
MTWAQWADTLFILKMGVLCTWLALKVYALVTR